MKKSLFNLTIFLSASILKLSCAKREVPENELTDLEKKDVWVLFFDGKSTEFWHLHKKGKIPFPWLLKDGKLHCLIADSTDLEHGDFASDKEYKDYEFKFDWKISKGGNSGEYLSI